MDSESERNAADIARADAILLPAQLAPDRVIAAFPCPHRRSHDRQRQPVGRQERFEEKYLSQNTSARRRGNLPSNAYLSFDATEHLIHAIGLAGLNPYTLQKTLRAMGKPAVARRVDGKWHRVALPVR